MTRRQETLLNRGHSLALPFAMAGLMLAGGLLSAPARAQSRGDKPEASKAARERKKEKDDVRRRQEWFYRQRRYPLPMIPGGARQQALQQREASRREQVRRGMIAESSSSDPSFNAWTAIGPTPTAASGYDFLDEVVIPSNITDFSGRINAIAVDPASPNIIYLGGADGGLWRSTDTGATWTVLTDFQPSLAIGAIAIDPGSCSAGYCQTVYVGTGESNNAIDNYYGAGVLKLTMTGSAASPAFTFTQLGANANSVTLIQPYTAPAGIPAPTSFVGPFDVAVGGSYFSDIVVNPAAGHNNQLLAAVRIFVSVDQGESSGIFCSDNAGVSWTQVVRGAAGSALVISPDGSTAYGALGTFDGSPNNGIYKTTNATAACASQSWSLIAGPSAFSLPSEAALGRISLAIAPPAPTTLYAAIANGGTDTTTREPDDSSDLINVYKSTNGGTTWKATGAPNTCTAQCFYDMTIKVHPNNANVVFLGGAAVYNTSNGNDIYLLRSENGGGTWDDGTLTTEIAFDGNNEIHVDQHAIAFSPPACNTTSCVMLVGNDGGIWSTPINGTSTTGTGTVSWTDLNSTLTLSQFYPGISIHPSSQLVAIGGLQDNGSQKYTGSTTWTQINGADGGATYFDPVSPNVAFATTEFNFPTPPGEAPDIFFIQKSVNGGDIDPTGAVTFSPATNGINLNGAGSDYAEFIPQLAGDPTPGNNRVLYYPTCQIYQSRDGADNWTSMTSSSLCGFGVADYVFIAAAADGNTVYAVDSIGHVHVTTNAIAGAAATWTDVSKSPLPSATSTTNPVDGRESVSVAVSPANPQFALVGYSGFCGFTNSSTGITDTVGHIFETQDGGSTWKDLSGGCNATPGQSLPNTPVNAIVIDPSDPTNNTIYVATDVGVFITSNNGGTWTLLDQSPRTLPDGAVLSLSLRNASRTLRAGLHGRGVWDYQLPLTAAQQTFSLASISPMFGVQGSGNPITLTVNGQGLSGGTVNFNGVGLTTTQVSATQLNATIPAAMLTNAGTASITVVNAASTSNAVPFSVEVVYNGSAPAPPNDAATSAIVVPSGMTSFTDVENTANAPTVAPGPNNPAPPGTCTAAGTAAGKTLASSGVANAIWYSYTPASNTLVEADTVGSVPPNTTAALNAGIFESGADTILQVLTGSPGSFTSVTCNDDINLSGSFLTSEVSFSAAVGTTYYFMVSQYEGVGGITVFNLTSTPMPTLTSIMPSSGTSGTSFTVTLMGSGFTAPLTLNFAGTGGTFSNVQVVSSSEITATLTLSSGAPTAMDTVSVTDSQGIASNTVSFQVTTGPPTVASITPSTGAQGGTVPVTVMGANFVSSATIVPPAGMGISVTGTTFVNSGELTATFNISGTATLGAQTINVMSGGMTTATGVTFTVEPPPSLTSLSITSGNQGATTPSITLTGTNFFSPASITFSGTGITANSPTVTSGTTITATFTIAANAPLGAQTVFVTTDGVTTSNLVQFTVIPAVPTVTSFSPAGATFGSNVLVTITGANFVATPGFPTIQSTNGVTIGVTNIQVMNNGTVITAMFSVPAAPFVNNANVTVTTCANPACVSNPVTFGVGSDFTIAANPTTQTVTRGTTPGMTVLTLSPTTMNSPFPATVTFNVTGLPTESTCTLNGASCSSFTLPASSAVGAMPPTVTLAITTTAPSLLAPRTAPWDGGPLRVQPWVLLAALTLLCLLFSLLVRRRRAGLPVRVGQYALAILLVIALAGLAAACGGGSSSMGPPPNQGSQPIGPNAITIMATSGNASHPATYTLTLQ